MSGGDKKRRRKTVGRYANYFRIGHNPYEFPLEFGQLDSGIHTSIYLSPQQAKMLSDLLTLYASTIFNPRRLQMKGRCNKLTKLRPESHVFRRIPGVITSASGMAWKTRRRFP